MSLGIGLNLRLRLRKLGLFVGLLDEYSGAAVALSTRKLLSTYNGSALRVRRSSDDAELDIGFTSSGNLDTSALLTFCGVGDGFVTKWYDQSGNGVDVVQATASSQLYIVESGSVVMEGSRPTLKNPLGGTRFLKSATDVNIVGGLANMSIFNVHKWLVEAPTAGIGTVAGQYETGTNKRVWRMLAGTGSGRDTGFQWSTDGTSGNIDYTRWQNENTMQDIYTKIADLSDATASTKIRLWLSGVLQTLSSSSTVTGTFLNTTAPFTVGAFWTGAAGSQYFEGTTAELIIYASDQETNRAAIDANINNYYEVF